MRRSTTFLLSLSLLLACFVSVVSAQEIPPRPEGLSYPPLSFDVPSAEKLKEQLDNQTPVYISEDRLLPLISVRAYFKGGQYMEPEDKAGLADLTGEVWRTGGAGDLDPNALDEEIDFLAASISTSVGPVTGSISLNLLAKDLDRGLELMMDVLLRPQFDQSRLDKAKEDFLASMKRRNDDTSDIESREWNRLIYGEDHWLNHLPTQGSIGGITREDLIAFHQRITNPANMIIAVAGDFDRASMLAKLNATFGKLEAREEALPAIPQPAAQPAPGIYIVNKEDVNQGRVSIGHIGLKQPVEEEFDLGIANDILGGSGFTSWVMSRVRSDEGLAYSAGTSFGIGNTIPGTFRAYFQTKSASCARAAQLTIDLIKKMRIEGPSEAELATSSASFIQTFPNRFQSALQTVGLYAMDDLFERPHEYWVSYRDRVRQVTVQSSKDAADKYIHPDDFIVLIVGNAEEILKGDIEHPDITFEKMGPIYRVPLRDPLTQEVME